MTEATPVSTAPESPDCAGQGGRLASFFLDSEADFYGRYPWCLNPYPTIGQVIGHLRSELRHLDAFAERWQLEEMMTNICMLSFAISDSADDCLGSKRYEFSRRFPRPLRPVAWVPQAFLNARQRYAQSRLAGLRAWRELWEQAVHRLLVTYVRTGPLDPAAFREAATRLVGHLEGVLPVELTRRQINSPRAFRSQDYAFQDIVTLARKFCLAHQDPGQPALVVGMRTAGSYFGPILRACLEQAGYKDTGIITLRPKGGVSPADQDRLRSWAGRGAVAVVIDEPVYQGGTLASCIQILRKAGFDAAAIHALFPVHPAGRDWHRTNAAVALSGCPKVTVEPEETFKYACLRPDRVQEVLGPYFAQRGWSTATLVEDDRARELNQQLARDSDEWFRTRLKQVYAVRLEEPGRPSQTRYVIAKSIGWGWAGYQAFFAALCLAPFIPPVLGYRNGILFSEWVGGGASDLDQGARARTVERIAEYVAARVMGLRFAEDPSPALCRARLQLGMDMLGELLFGVYRSSRLARLKRHWIREELSQLSSPAACLLDGRMRIGEWVQTDAGLLKTDFEQHGMGRMDFSFTDPAYDLAEAMLAFELTGPEESALLERYRTLTGDVGIADRLPLYKLAAGLAVMDSTYQLLGHPKLTARHGELNRAYVNAWTFSVIQMARLCAQSVSGPAPSARMKPVSESGPVVFCDVDGVIDQQVFSFPTTTPSGMRALALLRGHGLPVYLNTARSCHDVKEYCAAYGLQGGVAESGSYVWDAATGREQAMVAGEALAQIDRVREALERLPGVFTNHFYRYSIKAYTYRGGNMVPLQTSMVNRVLAQAQATLLAVHTTASDTTITARDVDKGTGLLALLKLIGRENASTIAIGDTGPDLAMFRVAGRSYAPQHTPVRALATLLGCRVMAEPFQKGFLQIARHIVHPDGATCPHCIEPGFPVSGQGRLLVELLGEVEKSRTERLRGALLDRRSMAAFLRANAGATRT